MIPSLFIGSERADVIYWDFTDSLDVMMGYIPEICSYELLEAYLNIVDVLKQYYCLENIPAIRLSDASYKMIQQEKLYLSGESMGLAWMLGILCKIKGKVFPTDLYAWGAIKPIRDGSYSLFPTSNTGKKINLCCLHGKKKIMLHHAERIYKYRFSGDAVRFKSNLTEVIKTLEIMIDAY